MNATNDSINKAIDGVPDDANEVPWDDARGDPRNDGASADTSAGILKIAVHAVGGQGGGVLANWISDVATLGNYAVQMTSVAGVAQRTGATIYYIEMAPKGKRDPVFSLTPAPGDVDILIAAELMEAGRAVVRGFVSPDRTTLIASTHRILAVDEKIVPSDGRADSPLVEAKVKAAAFKSLCFDMESIANNAGSVISASLFGALAKSGETPFSVTMYEQVIRTSGRGVEASLAAFRGALEFDDSHPVINIKPLAEKPLFARSTTSSDTVAVKPVGPAHMIERWESLLDELARMPAPVKHIAGAGMQKAVDYQDLDYGGEYVQHLAPFLAVDTAADYRLTQAAAKYIANAMCYDDIVRVADLKTRASRDNRLRHEQQAVPGQIVQVTEYFHPRAQEICGMLPAWLGGWIENHPTVFSMLDGLVNKGRRIRTDSMTGFGVLWIASALKRWRRNMLRHQHESAHLQRLKEAALTAADTDHDLAIEVLRCQRVVKGYSDTHTRGQSKFGLLMDAMLLLQPHTNAATRLADLRKIALKHETVDVLKQRIANLQSE